MAGFEGSPPYCHRHGEEVGCSKNPDCPENLTCIGGTCQDPCQGLVVCGLDATCDVIKHLPVCRCSFHRTGDPFLACDRQGKKIIAKFVKKMRVRFCIFYSICVDKNIYKDYEVYRENRYQIDIIRQPTPNSS